MQNFQFIENNYTDFIELTMVDEMRIKKTVLLLFNLNDGWESKEIQKEDVPGMFAGHIMEIFRKDRRAFAYRATAYTIKNSEIKKSITFTPMMKLYDEFKPCHIHENGRVSIVD